MAQKRGKLCKTVEKGIHSKWRIEMIKEEYREEGRPLPQDADPPGGSPMPVKAEDLERAAEKLGLQKVQQYHPTSRFSISVAKAKLMTKNPTRKNRSGTKICDTPAPFSITARRASLE